MATQTFNKHGEALKYSTKDIQKMIRDELQYDEDNENKYIDFEENVEYNSQYVKVG